MPACRLLHARLALAVTLSLCPLAVAADTDNGLVARLSYLNIESGLSGDLVITMAQDSQGFVWIGTDGGLDRYDGNRIRSFETLQDKTVSSLLAARDGRLWVGTWGNGLYRYDPVTEDLAAFHNDAGNGLQSEYVDSLAELGDGRIAIGSQAGVDLLEPHSGTVERLPIEEEGSPTNLRVRHLLADSRGNLWVATRAGLYVKGPREQRLRMYQPDDRTVLRENIYALIEDHDGALLLGTSAGMWRLATDGNLARYMPAGFDSTFLHQSRISSLLLTRTGDLFIGTLEHGALLEQRQRGLTRTFTQHPTAPYGIHDNQVASLLETSDGSLWIGTLTRGISRASPLSLALEHYIAVPGMRNALADKRVTSLVAQDDVMFVATESALSQFERSRRRFTSVSAANGWNLPPEFDGIQKIVPASDGRFWLIGDRSRNRLYQMNPRTRTIETIALTRTDGAPLQGFLVNVQEDSNGTVWIAWYESLLGRVDPRSGRVEVFTITDPRDRASLFVNGFAYHQRHGLVVSTDRGVLAVGADGAGRWLVQPEGNAPANAATFNDDGSFWVSTDSGAYRYSADGELLLRLTQSDGLPNGKLTAIASDAAGRTWFVTGRGVTVRETDGSLRTLRARDGLQSDHVVSVDFTAHGDAVVAGPNGFNLFRYESLKDALLPAAFRTTSIEIFTADGGISTRPATDNACSPSRAGSSARPFLPARFFRPAAQPLRVPHARFERAVDEHREHAAHHAAAD